MTYRLIAMGMVPWMIGAALTAIALVTNTPGSAAGGSSQGFEDFSNAIMNPEEIDVGDPSAGISSSDENPISTVIAYGKLTVGWLVFMARAATLSHPWFEEPWSKPIQTVCRGLLSIGIMFIIAKEVVGLFSNFIGGVFGAARP